MELGIYTFAELTADPATGKKTSAHQRMRDLMEEVTLAEQVGLDVFAVGEHHRPDYIVSSPAVVLGAAGFVLPKPLIGVSAGIRPWPAIQSRTVVARASESLTL